VVNKKRIICGVLISLLILQSYLAVVVSADKSADKTKEIETSAQLTSLSLLQVSKDSAGKTIFENNSLAMTLEEETLEIAITDKKTGYQYVSTKSDDNINDSWKGFTGSGVAVEFYSNRSTMPERVDIMNGKPEMGFTYYEDGFDVDINFVKYEFQMSLEVRLTGDGFTSHVKADSILEGETYKLAAIYLYPLFGATKLGEEEGYMFVPEGAGALIDLADNHGKYKTPYAKKIYGDNVGIDKFTENEAYRPSVKDPEDITIPVFGMVYTKKEQGFLGIVEDGQYNAEILAYPNGVTTNLNWITAKFNFRGIYTMQTSKETGVPSFEKKAHLRDIGIRYQLVSGETANYTGLAKTYQTYLINNGVLKKQEDKFQVKLDFLGADSKKWFLFDVVVPMTTVDQMEDIITSLQEDEVEDILPVYLGWQAKGISRNYGSGNFKLEGKLGSQKKLLSLIEKLKLQDIDLVLQQDLLWANSSRVYNTTKDIVKGINQVIVEEPTNAYVYKTMYYLTPSKSLEYAKKMMKRYSDTAAMDIAITGISSTLFSYYSGGDIYSRSDTAQKYMEVMNVYDAVNLSLVRPFNYLWEYTNRYFDLPMSTSNYSYLSKEIPFLPIVLKGYIPYWATYTNFKANEKEYFLKMIEYGAYPSFLITSASPNHLRDTNSSYIYTSEFAGLRPTINKYYDEIGDVMRLVEGARIQSHNYIADQIVAVVYDNDVQIIINYSSEDFSLGNVAVPALSYHVN
jgi:hypothetical protein